MILAFAFVTVKSCLLSFTRNYPGFVPPEQHLPTNLINLAIQCESQSTNEKAQRAQKGQPMRKLKRDNQRHDRILEV